MKRTTTLKMLFLALVGTPAMAQVWTPQVSGTTNDVWGASFISSSVGWVSGASGMILHTTNGGGTWTAQTTGVGATLILRSVTFTDASNGWSVGDNGTIIHTSNGGTTWTA